MSLYGDFDQQFRPRPSAPALAAVGASLVIVSAVAVSLVRSLTELAVSMAGGVRHPLAVYAPFPPTTALLYSQAALRPPATLLPLLLPALLLIFALLVGRFWPTEQRLATRLTALTLAMTAGVFGGLAPALEPHLFVSISFLSPTIWSVLLGAISAWAILLSERKMVDLMGTLFPSEAMAVRLRVWALRVPIGFLIVAVLAWTEGRRAVAMASLSAIVITFLENVSRRPRRYFEAVRDAPMGETAVVLPIVAAIVAGACIWTFGARTAARPPRALSFNSGHVELIPLATGALPGKIEMEIPQVKSKPTPRIRARWSRDREKGKEIVIP